MQINNWSWSTIVAFLKAQRASILIGFMLYMGKSVKQQLLVLKSVFNAV